MHDIDHTKDNVHFQSELGGQDNMKAVVTFKYLKAKGL